MPKLTAEDVADAVIYALSTPPHVQVIILNKKKTKQSIRLHAKNLILLIGARSYGETIG